MSLTVVTGPPCSGKSTHVMENATPGALIIDLDRIALALTTPDVVSHHHSPTVGAIARTVRNAALDPAIAQSDAHEVWIIDSSPTPRSLSRHSIALASTMSSTTAEPVPPIERSYSASTAS